MGIYRHDGRKYLAQWYDLDRMLDLIYLISDVTDRDVGVEMTINDTVAALIRRSMVEAMQKGEIGASETHYDLFGRYHKTDHGPALRRYTYKQSDALPLQDWEKLEIDTILEFLK